MTLSAVGQSSTLTIGYYFSFLKEQSVKNYDIVTSKVNPL